MERLVPRVGFGLLFLIVFNIIYFVVGGLDHGAAEWISYVFILASLLCAILAPQASPHAPSHSTLVGSVALAGVVYFALELAVGVAFILLWPNAWQGALVTQLILLAIFLALAITLTRANARTNRAEERQLDERRRFNNLIASAQMLASATQTEDLRAEIQRIVEDLRCSPVRSAAETIGIEEMIAGELNELHLALEANDAERASSLCIALRQHIAQRNQMLIMLR